MRVITGTARGKRLITLEGDEVRPTTDKVKEAIFSVIQFDIPGARVLDLFGGCGQLGIEALSRGADSAVIVDLGRRSVDIIKKNVDACGFLGRAKIVWSDAADYLKTSPVFDIALLDPPYNKGLLGEVLPLLEKKISDGGTVVCEHEAGLALSDRYGRLVKIKEYGYGKHVAVTTFRAED